MPPARHDFDLVIGDTFAETVSIYESDDDSAPLDLSGYSARMHWRMPGAAGDLLAEFTVANGRVEVAANSIVLRLDAADCAAMPVVFPAGMFPATISAIYDLELTAPGGAVSTILQGVVRLRRDVTRGA